MTKRRDFIQLMGLSSMFLVTGLGCIPDKKGRKKLKNWAWLGEGKDTTDEEWYTLLKGLKDNNIHGVVPSGSNEHYKKLGKMTKELGLDMHTWRFTMNRRQYMEERPELYAVSREGKSVIDSPPYVDYYRWLCPSHPDVKDILIKDYTELCAIEGVTAVHLDYVRFCDVILPIALQPKYNLVQDHEMPQFDFCYCERCRSKFKEQHGTDPIEMEDPSKSEEWHRFRLDLVVDIVNAVAEAVHKTGKEISAAVFPTPTIARKIVRQDWEQFNLDAFFPMIYFQDYKGDLDWIKEVVQEDAEVVKKKNAKLYTGLHLGHVRELGKGLKPVVDACIDNGADGVCFFYGD